MIEEAQGSNAQRAFTLAKEFNIKQLASTAWLEDKYILNDATFELEDFRNTWCIIGVDLAETNDLCCCTYLFMHPDDKVKYMHTMYFVTSIKAGDELSTQSPTNTENKNYREWADLGYCRIIDNNVIDDDVVAKYLWEVYDKYKIRPFRVGYDAWHAKEFAKITTQNFGENVTQKIKMNYEALNIPMRTLEQDLRSKVINYNNNEICRWCLRNTAIKHNSIGWVMPEKIKGYIGNKIDGTVSKIIAYATLRECKSAFLNKVK